MVGAYAYVVEEFFDMYSALGIREHDNRVWEHVIGIKNVGAGAYTAFDCNGGTSPRYKVECFHRAARFQKSIGTF